MKRGRKIYVFYNSVTGEIYYKKLLKPDQAHRMCQMNHSMNMTCKTEQELGNSLANTKNKKVCCETDTIIDKPNTPIDTVEKPCETVKRQ